MIFETSWTPCKKPHFFMWPKSRNTFFLLTPYVSAESIFWGDYSTWSKEFQNSREAISVELLHRMWWNLIWQCIFRCFTPFKVFDVIRWTFFTTPKRDIFQPIWSHHWILRKISLNLKKKSTFYDQRFRSYGQLNFSPKF